MILNRSMSLNVRRTTYSKFCSDAAVRNLSEFSFSRLILAIATVLMNKDAYILSKQQWSLTAGFSTANGELEICANDAY